MKAVPELPEPWPLYAGDDEALEITVRDENCDRVSLEGYDVSAAWRCRSCSEDEVELGVNMERAKEGVIMVTVAGSLTAVDGGVIRDGVFDVQTVKDDVTRTVLRGDVTWMGDVER